MIDRDGTVKLIDLANVHVAGLAEGWREPAHTIPPGTLQYMAPECLLGQAAGVEADLRGRILATFDPDAIERDLVESLRNRAIVQEALVRNKTQWEYEPRFDVTYPYTPGRPKA